VQQGSPPMFSRAHPPTLPHSVHSSMGAGLTMRLLQETSSPKGMDTGHQPHYPAAVELSHPQRCRKHP
jgi:hypothetical protein